MYVGLQGKQSRKQFCAVSHGRLLLSACCAVCFGGKNLRLALRLRHKGKTLGARAPNPLWLRLGWTPALPASIGLFEAICPRASRVETLPGFITSSSVKLPCQGHGRSLELLRLFSPGQPAAQAAAPPGESRATAGLHFTSTVSGSVRESRSGSLVELAHPHLGRSPVQGREVFSSSSAFTSRLR